MNRDFVVAFLRRIGLVMLSIVGLAVFTPSAHATMTPAILGWSPSPFDFGGVVPPATASETFTLFNSGGMSSGTIAVTLSGSSAFVVTADGCTGKALAPKKSCGVTVEYEPTTTTGDTGTLNATAEKAATSVNLSGNGTPDLSWSPSPFDFGSVVPPATATQTFTLSNVEGGSSVTIVVTLSGSTAFVITADGCTGKALGPNESCGVTVEYEPTTTTGDTGTLTATAGKASTSVNLSGNEIPDLTLSPGTFLETVNGTNFYDASSALKNSGVPVQFFVSNVGTGISEVLSTANQSDPEFNSFFLPEDCRQIQLAPFSGSCFFTLTFTLPNGCTSGTVYNARFEVFGFFPTAVTYIHLGATETCP